MLNNELEGLFVVSLEQAVAAPYCGMLLADAGARVVKVERLEGDFARGYDAGAAGQSTIFAWLNRGKQSVCLNLKERDDLKIMRNMLKIADIFISNLAPGAVSRMGLDGDTLRKGNPGLITSHRFPKNVRLVNKSTVFLKNKEIKFIFSIDKEN